MNVWNIFYGKYKFTEIENHSLKIRVTEPLEIIIIIFNIFALLCFMNIFLFTKSQIEISIFNIIFALLFLFGTIKIIREFLKIIRGKSLDFILKRDTVNWKEKTVCKISEISLIKLVEKLNGNAIPNSYYLVFHYRNEDLFEMEETLNKENVQYIGKRISETIEIELRYSRITD